MTQLINSLEAALGPTGGTTGSIDTSGANLIVIVVSTYKGGSAPTVSDNKSNTYTALTARTATTNSRVQLYYCSNPTVGTGHTFSITGSNTWPGVAVAAFSGIKTSSPFDQENGAGAATSGTTHQPGSITPSENGELIILGTCLDTTVTLTVDSSMTIEQQSPWVNNINMGYGLAWLIQSTASSINPTWTASSTTNFASAIASFKSQPSASSNNSVKASIVVSNSQNSSVKSNISTSVSVTKNNSVKSNIKVTNTKTVSVKSNIKVGVTKSNSTKSNIKVTNTKSNSIKACIRSTNQYSNNTKANVLVTTTQNNSTKSNIVIFGSNNNSVKASIVTTTSANNSSKGYVKLPSGPFDLIRNNYVSSSKSLLRVNDTLKRRAVTFTARRTKTIAKIGVSLEILGSPGTFRLGLQASSGGQPTNTWLGSTNSGYAEVSGISSNGFKVYTLTETVNLTQGTTYHIVLYPLSGTWDASNYVDVAVSNNDNNIYWQDNSPHTNEGVGVSNDSGSNWTMYTTYSPSYLLVYDNDSDLGEGNPSDSLNYYIYVCATRRLVQKIYSVSQHTINGASFFCLKFGTPTGDLLYEVLDSDFSTVLASGTLVSTAGGSSSGQWETVTFSSPITLNPTTNYYLRLKAPDNTEDTSNCWGSNYFGILYPDGSWTQDIISAIEDNSYDGGYSFVKYSTDSGSTYVDYLQQDIPFRLIEQTTQNNSVLANINLAISTITKVNSVISNIKSTYSKDNQTTASIVSTGQQSNEVTSNILKIGSSQVNQVTANIRGAPGQFVKANISPTKFSNNDVKANIVKTNTLDNSTKSNIKVVGNTKDNSSKSNIKTTYTNTNSTKSNILTGYLKENSTKANIVVTGQIPNSVKANILNSYTSDNDAKSNILRVNEEKENSVVANILNTYEDSNSSLSNILVQEQKDNSTKANILVLDNEVENSSKSDILSTQSFDNFTTANLYIAIHTYESDNNVKANILNIYDKENSVLTNILATGQQFNNSKANILVSDNTEDNSSIGNILVTNSFDNNVKASIVVENVFDNSTKLNILATSTQENSTKANILNSYDNINYVLSNVLNTYSKENSVIGNILATGQFTNYVKANILREGETQGNHSKANILTIYEANNSSKANILNVYGKDNQTTANIVVENNYTVNTKANILSIYSQDNQSKANILNSYNQDNNVVSNIAKSKFAENFVKSSIVRTETYDVFTKAYLSGVSYNYVLANIYIPWIYKGRPYTTKEPYMYSDKGLPYSNKTNVYADKAIPYGTKMNQIYKDRI